MSDPNHLPSIKSCLVRVPGTINSKNGEAVRIVQKWDGNRPTIKYINATLVLFDTKENRQDKGKRER